MPISWETPSYHVLADGLHCGHDHTSLRAARHCARAKVEQYRLQTATVIRRYPDGARQIADTIRAQLV